MPIQPGFIDRMGWQVKVALEWRGSQDEEDGIATYSLPGKKFNLWMPSFEHARRDMQELLQGHVIDQNDMRLVGLLHLLGQAARRMESELWPDADKADTHHRKL